MQAKVAANVAEHCAWHPACGHHTLHPTVNPPSLLKPTNFNQHTHAQAKVAAKAAEHRAETRWFWQRAADVVRDKEALGAWAYRALPDTVSEWWTLLLIALVGSFVVSCINTFAQSAKAEEDDATVDEWVRQQQKGKGGKAAAQQGSKAAGEAEEEEQAGGSKARSRRPKA